MLYQNVKSRADKQSLTISQLERKCGFSSGSIAKWDKHKPSIDRVKLAASNLGCTIDELMREE